MPMGQPARDSDERLPEYAWPGGYAVMYVTDDGATLCGKCANGDNGSEASYDPEMAYPGTGWLMVGWDSTDWSEELEICEHCGATIYDPED